jgi:hypothetical protein
MTKKAQEQDIATAPTGRCDLIPPQCLGTGYVSVERRAYSHATHQFETVNAMDYCACTLGQWMKQKAWERGSKAQAQTADRPGQSTTDPEETRTP